MKKLKLFSFDADGESSDIEKTINKWVEENSANIISINTYPYSRESTIMGRTTYYHKIRYCVLYDIES